MARYTVWQIGRGFIMETGSQHEAISKAHELVRKTGQDVMVKMYYQGHMRTRWYPAEKEALGWA